jgi:hypothetical protein
MMFRISCYNHIDHIPGVTEWFLQTFSVCMGLKGGKFEIGNIWSETFPSYWYRRWYCGWKSRQPARADFTPAFFLFHFHKGLVVVHCVMASFLINSQ